MVSREVEFEFDGRCVRHLVGHGEPDDDVACSLRKCGRLRSDVGPGCFRTHETYCENRRGGESGASKKSRWTKCHWMVLPSCRPVCESVARRAGEVPRGA